MKKFNTKDLALNSIIGASYFILVAVFNVFSFTAEQFRIAEVLLVLLLFNTKLAPGLLTGTLVANLVFSPFGPLDALFGTLASLVAIGFMILFRKIPFVSLLMPAIFNGLIVGLFIHFMATDNVTPFIVTFGWIFFGEFIVMYVLGIPLYYLIKKNEAIQDLIK